jgi:glycosyltransferase involved in cell wall biosynthesis
MNSSPRVSVLFPVYKTAAFLKEAVDSMLSQTFTDFELIVLNDCSPDEAEEILDTYNDPRIVRYRGAKNVGLGNVLNVGVSLARGEYIARMDSDDISLPERLRVQVDYLDAYPEYDLVSVGMREFGEGIALHFYDNETEQIKFNALFHSPVLHASSMWRKDSFVGLLYDQSFVPSEDYDLWTRALVKGIRMRNLPEILYLYRKFDGQATSNITSSKWIIANERYIQAAFPDVESKRVEEWSRSLVGRKDPSLLKSTLEEMVLINRMMPLPFFDPALFEKNAKRYYQAVLFGQLKNGEKGPVFDLRFKQIAKLYSYKLFHSRHV